MMLSHWSIIFDKLRVVAFVYARLIIDFFATLRQYFIDVVVIIAEYELEN